MHTQQRGANILLITEKENSSINNKKDVFLISKSSVNSFIIYLVNTLLYLFLKILLLINILLFYY